MDIYTASEVAFRNGYEAGVKEFAVMLNNMMKDYAPYDTLHIYEIKDRIDIAEEELTESK